MLGLIDQLSVAGEKLAKLIGLDDHINDIVKNKIDPEMQKISEWAKSLSDFLNYKYFDRNSSLFFNDDGLCGFLMELSPIVGSDETLTKNLSHFFNDEMPPSSFIQFLLVASTNIEPTIDVWKKGRISDISALKRLAEGREEFLNKTARNFKKFSGRNARNFKVYLCFTGQVFEKVEAVSKTGYG
jgi:TraC protein